MLGFIGFICAAIIITVFAATSYRAFLTFEQSKRWAFSVAFMLLAVAMAIWAICCLVPAVAVGRFMLLSDIILLVATGFIGSTLAGKYVTYFVVTYPFFAGVLLVKRIYDYAPATQVQDGLLYFNLQPAAKSIILGLLLFVWLPAIVYLAYKGMRHRLLINLRNGVNLLFTTMIISTAILLSARRSVVVIASFIGIVALFAAATFVNIAMARIYAKQGSGHGAK